MKIAGHGGILSFKNKRLEITLIIAKVYIFSSSLALLMAVSVRHVLHQIQISCGGKSFYAVGYFMCFLA